MRQVATGSSLRQLKCLLAQPQNVDRHRLGRSSRPATTSRRRHVGVSFQGNVQVVERPGIEGMRRHHDDRSHQRGGEPTGPRARTGWRGALVTQKQVYPILNSRSRVRQAHRRPRVAGMARGDEDRVSEGQRIRSTMHRLSIAGLLPRNTPALEIGREQPPQWVDGFTEHRDEVPQRIVRLAVRSLVHERCRQRAVVQGGGARYTELDRGADEADGSNRVPLDDSDAIEVRAGDTELVEPGSERRV